MPDEVTQQEIIDLKAKYPSIFEKYQIIPEDMIAKALKEFETSSRERLYDVALDLIVKLSVVDAAMNFFGTMIEEEGEGEMPKA